MEDTPAVRTVRAAFWDYVVLLLGKGLSIPLMLVVLGLMTRILGKEGYGSLSVFLLVGQFFFLVAANWPGPAVVRFGREEFLHTAQLGRTFWACNLILLATTAVVTALVLLFRRELLGYIGISELSAWILVVYLVVFTINNYASRVLQATENLRFGAFLNPISHAVTVAALVIIGFTHPRSTMIAVIGAYLLGKLASGIWGFAWCGSRLSRPAVLDPDSVKRILRFSYPLLVGTLCNYVVGSIDIFVIKHCLTNADVGVYALAYQGMTVLSEIPLAAMTLTAPLVLTFRAESKDHLTCRYVDTVIPGAVFVWGLLLVPVVFLAPILIPLVSSSQFAGSTLSFRILCVAVAFAALRSLYYAIYTNYDMTKAFSVVTALLAAANVIADIILVPRMGIIGAAIGTTIAFALASMLDIFLCQRRLGIRQPAQIAMVLPILAYVVLVGFSDSMIFDALAGLAVLVVSILVARMLGVIDLSHLDLFAQVDMPEAVRSVLTWTYKLLAAEKRRT